MEATKALMALNGIFIRLFMTYCKRAQIPLTTVGKLEGSKQWLPAEIKCISANSVVQFSSLTVITVVTTYRTYRSPCTVHARMPSRTDLYNSSLDKDLPRICPNSARDHSVSEGYRENPTVRLPMGPRNTYTVWRRTAENEEEVTAAAELWWSGPDVPPRQEAARGVISTYRRCSSSAGSGSSRRRRVSIYW